MLSFCFGIFGTLFQKSSKWMVNNPALSALEGRCSCPLRGQHLRWEPSFSRENIGEFKCLCRPNCTAVFGREPKVGEFSGELQEPAISGLAFPKTSSDGPAPTPPRWIGDLGHGLDWKTLAQYTDSTK